MTLLPDSVVDSIVELAGLVRDGDGLRAQVVLCVDVTILLSSFTSSGILTTNGWVELIPAPSPPPPSAAGKDERDKGANTKNIKYITSRKGNMSSSQKVTQWVQYNNTLCWTAANTSISLVLVELSPKPVFWVYPLRVTCRLLFLKSQHSLGSRENVSTIRSICRCRHSLLCV